MNLSSMFQINSPHVVSETIDGEAIIIHLETGTYFSARDTAVRVWNLVEQGATVRQIITALTSETEGDPLEISLSVSAFLSKLEENLLIRAAKGDAPALSFASPEVKAPFVEPVLMEYRDMQNLLMLDPIHQIDPEIGWPAPPPTDG
jgi:hypothetical protein